MNSIATQIFLGSRVIPITILVQVWFIRVAIVRLKSMNGDKNRHFSTKPDMASTLKVVLVLSISTLWLLAALSIAIWIWAGFFSTTRLF
jgi:hypothetical protein